MPQVQLIPERPPQQSRQPEPRQQQKQQQHSLRTDLDRSSKAALSQGGAAELHSLGSSSHDPRHLDEASALAELDRFRLSDPGYLSLLLGYLVLRGCPTPPSCQDVCRIWR